MRIHQLMTAVVAGSFALTAASSVSAQSGAPPGAPPAAVGKPSLSPSADRVLRQMSEYLGSAQELTFHADVLFDHVLPSGQKLQYSAGEDVALQRPGRLYVEWTGDLGDRQFWFDGAAVTLYDPSTPYFATQGAAADVDSMLDTLTAQVGFAPPLDDFLYRDPYKTFAGDMIYSTDLGLTEVNGRNCRALAFVGKDIDWEIWIGPATQPTPCKVVITYKTHPSQPQFSAVFTDWDFAPRVPVSAFTPDLPPGVRKVPFSSVTSAQ
jgi:hypothetical protein